MGHNSVSTFVCLVGAIPNLPVLRPTILGQSCHLKDYIYLKTSSRSFNGTGDIAPTQNSPSDDMTYVDISSACYSKHDFHRRSYNSWNRFTNHSAYTRLMLLFTVIRHLLNDYVIQLWYDIVCTMFYYIIQPVFWRSKHIFTFCTVIQRINFKNLKFTLNVRTIITLRKQQKLFLHDFVALSAR